MKLAEALILRADLQKRIEQLKGRLTRNAKVQEGDRPAEQPEALLAEFVGAAADLESLIRRVNTTNSNVLFDGQHRISDAIAMRDSLDLRIRMIRAVIEAASERERLFTRSEIKFVPMVDPALLQKQLDGLSRRRRELDMRLQAVNWKVDLIDVQA
jgi:hypothetical protein